MNNLNYPINNNKIPYFNNQQNIENKEAKERRKRRSKHESEGRTFVCECGKAYLSSPALISHKKTKHGTEDDPLLKRGRGRPRKNTLPSTHTNSVVSDEKFKYFMNTVARHRNENEMNYEIKDFTHKVFQEIYIDYMKFLPKEYRDMNEHPLFIKIEMNKSMEGYLNQSKNCDQMFFEYLKFLSGICNTTYFIFGFKFVCLFREALNKYRQNEQDTNIEYSRANNSEKVPELCNEFISDFLENANYFGMNSDQERNEFVELIQHFCYWMFENNYTTSKLTLV